MLLLFMTVEASTAADRAESTEILDFRNAHTTVVGRICHSTVVKRHEKHRRLDTIRPKQCKSRMIGILSVNGVGISLTKRQ